MSFDKQNKNYLNIISSSSDVSARDCAVQWAEASKEIQEITSELDLQKHMFISGGLSSKNWSGLVDWIDNTKIRTFETSLMNDDDFF